MKIVGKMSSAIACVGLCSIMAFDFAHSNDTTTDNSSKNTDSSNKKVVGDKIVASFNNKVIYQSEIDKAVNLYMDIAKARKMQSPDRAKLFMMVLEAKIRTEVIKASAKQAGIDRSKEFFARLNEMQDQLLMELYLEKEITSKITESALKGAYKQLSDSVAKEKEHKVRHILVKEESMAKEIIAKLDKGEDFAKLADQYNAMAREKGGDLGYIIINRMPEPINKAIADLKAGTYTKEAVKSEVGYHIFKLEDVRDAKVPPFEEAKPRLAEIVKQESMEALVKRLVAQAKVKVFVNSEASQ